MSEPQPCSTIFWVSGCTGSVAIRGPSAGPTCSDRREIEASGEAEALLENRSDLRRLDKLIEALPEPLRETIVLRELHELGYREIADVTDVPIGTVMSRLHRARPAAPRLGYDGRW